MIPAAFDYVRARDVDDAIRLLREHGEDANVLAGGHAVTTIEGLGDATSLHPMQEAFWLAHGLQCGYCTTGMIVSAVDLLARRPDPSDAEIRAGLDGNLCRCTGYQNIVAAVRAAAAAMRANEPRRSVADVLAATANAP